jgi:hypothetical protein
MEVPVRENGGYPRRLGEIKTICEEDFPLWQQLNRNVEKDQNAPSAVPDNLSEPSAEAISMAGSRAWAMPGLS